MEGRAYAQSAIERPLLASLPRLFAPERPDRAAFVLPFVLLGGALAWAGLRGRSAPGGEALLLLGALPLAVVTSPTGWAMGLVWALPLVPFVLAFRRAGRLVRPAAIAFAAGFGLCAASGLAAPAAAVGGAVIVVAVAIQLRAGSVA